MTRVSIFRSKQIKFVKNIFSKSDFNRVCTTTDRCDQPILLSLFLSLLLRLDRIELLTSERISIAISRHCNTTFINDGGNSFAADPPLKPFIDDERGNAGKISFSP